MIHTIIFVAGRSLRFTQSLPPNYNGDKNKLLSILPTGELLIERLVRQFISISDHVYIIGDSDGVNFSSLENYPDVTYLEVKHLCGHNNGFSIKAYFNEVNKLPDKLIIVDGDTVIPSKDFLQVSQHLTTARTNIIVGTNKLDSNKSDNEWTIEPYENSSKIERVTLGSQTDFKIVTAGITELVGITTISKLKSYLTDKSTDFTYWDFFYYNAINSNILDFYLLKANYVYEVDNYNDLLYINKNLLSEV